MEKKKKQAENAIAKKNIAEAVLAKVNTMQETGGLVLPADYNPGNALTAAFLKIKETKDKSGAPAEAVCTPESATRALMDMVVQGLSPSKNQCYFIVYGNQLTLQRSYFGTVAATKRFGNVRDVFGQVVYKGDNFSFMIDPKTGNRYITDHEQTLESIEAGEIRAAYATIVFNDGSSYQEIMTIDEIRKAWAQGQTKGSSLAHKNFEQEMAKKTVINRACKIFLNASTDNTDEELAGAFNRTTANEHLPEDPEGQAGPIIDIGDEDIKAEAFDAILAGGAASEEPAGEAAQEPEQKDPEEGVPDDQI